jgi:hypothetical protein
MLLHLNVTTEVSMDKLSNFIHTRWFKYDRDKLWLVYTQIVPVIFEPPCINNLLARIRGLELKAMRTVDTVQMAIQMQVKSADTSSV